MSAAAFSLGRQQLAHRSRRRIHRRRLVSNSLAYVAIGLFVAFAIFPVYWMFIATFKQNSDLYSINNNPFWFNIPATWENVSYLFKETQFVRWCINTLEIALLVVSITLLVSIPAGYAFARLRFRGSSTLSIAIFLTYLVPPTLLFIPLSRVISQLHLQDTIWALVVVYPTFTIPFCTWLLMGFFKTVPFEIEEAAMVDGCGQFGALLRVVLPVSWPGIITAIIFSFTLSMQDFLYSLAFVSISEEKPVPLGVATELIRGDIYFWGSLMAGALLVGVPVAIVYNLFLDKFITGITGAAIK